MSETILVSVISEQTIPNVLLIKEFQEKYSQQLFITTKKMEEQHRSNFIERACNLQENSIKRICVDENNISAITTKLENEIDKNKNYIVNLTGGTKPMTLAIFNFFKSLNAQILYLPIGKNQYSELYPNENNTIDLNTLLDLKTYLLSYGVYCDFKNECMFSEKQSFQLFNDLKQIKFNFTRIPEIMKHQKLEDGQERVYYSGRWFEEYVFLSIKKNLKISDTHIGLNVKLSRTPNFEIFDNEYDVMFCKDNKLYVVECKCLTSPRTGYTRQKLDDFMYKLAAISRDFGLQVYSYIFVASFLKKSNNQGEGILKRQRILGIKKIISAEDFINKNFNFKEVFND